MYKDIKQSCLPSKTLLESRLFGLERRGQPGVLQPQRSLSWHSEHGEKPRLCFRLLSLEPSAGLGGSLRSAGSERGQFWAQHSPGWRSSSISAGFCGVFGVSEGVPSKRGLGAGLLCSGPAAAGSGHGCSGAPGSRGCSCWGVLSVCLSVCLHTFPSPASLRFSPSSGSWM